MKVSVFGSRELTEGQQKSVLMVWTELRKDKDICLLHGGSKGTQELIVKYEREVETNPHIILFKPWHFIDKSLVFSPKFMLKRNVQMLDNSDLVIIFDLGKEDNVPWIENYCEKQGIECAIIRGAPSSLSQEELGAPFDRVLNDNLSDLYEK